jgi:hypothetical protein
MWGVCFRMNQSSPTNVALANAQKHVKRPGGEPFTRSLIQFGIYTGGPDCSFELSRVDV